VSYGANRNLLIDDVSVDPLSQTSALSSGYVGVERV
jgi:formate dehydrogenase